jgi:hypothetical protein
VALLAPAERYVRRDTDKHCLQNAVASAGIWICRRLLESGQIIIFDFGLASSAAAAAARLYM